MELWQTSTCFGELRERISRASTTSKPARVLNLPGFGIDDLVASIDDAVSTERLETNSVAPIIPTPMSLSECAALLALPESHALTRLIRWVPASVDALRDVTSVYPESLLTAHGAVTRRVLAPQAHDMTRWLAQISDPTRRALELVALGPDRVDLADLTELVREDALIESVQSGLGVFSEGGFELNAFARWVLIESMEDDVKQRAASTLASVLLERKLEYPSVMYNDITYINYCQRNRLFFQAILDAASSPGVGSAETIEDALWSTGVLQILSRMDGGARAFGEQLSTLLERASAHDAIDPCALVCGLVSLLELSSQVDIGVDVEGVSRRALELAERHQMRTLTEHIEHDIALRAFRRKDIEHAVRLFEQHASAATCANISAAAQIMLARVADTPHHAESILERGLADCIERGSFYGVFFLRLSLATLAQRTNRASTARMQVELLTELSEEHQVYTHLDAELAAYRGRLELGAREYSRALDSYNRAYELLDRLGSGVKKAQCLYDMGYIYFNQREYELSAKYYEKSRVLFVRQKNKVFEQKALAWCAYVQLINHEATPEEREAHRVHAVGVLDLIDSTRSASNTPNSLEDIYDLLRGLAAPTSPIQVARDGSFFVDESGARVALDHRRVLRSVLSAMTRADGVITVQELMVRAWPSEQMTPQSGKNRVRVAVSTLRKLGLGDAISFDTTLQGYKLDASVILPH